MRPLEGVKIIDFSSAHAAVYTTMILADFGAEVIKLEKIGAGDAARYYTPFKENGSPYNAYLNRGKKSISINLASEEGKEIVKKLVSEADVVCENFRFGTLDKLGLGYEELKKVNPSIIFSSLSAFGKTGPMNKNNGLDLTLQAMGGMMDITGFNDGPPVKIGTPIADQFGGVYLALGIMLALIHRKRTGEGQVVDVAMLDSVFSMLEMGVITPMLTGQPTVRRGNGSPVIAPYDVFKTNDGYVSIGISTDAQWHKFCKKLQLEFLENDERFNSNRNRATYFFDGLQQAIEDKTSKISKYDVERLLREENLPVGAVCTVYEAAQSEQIKARDMVIEIEDKCAGKVSMFGIPVKMSNTPGLVTGGSPRLGEDTKAYLTNMGYSEEEIKNLLDKRIVEQA